MKIGTKVYQFVCLYLKGAEIITETLFANNEDTIKKIILDNNGNIISIKETGIYGFVGDNFKIVDLDFMVN